MAIHPVVRSFEQGVSIASLSREHPKRVEALGLGFQMPLAEQRRLVARLLQSTRHGDPSGIERIGQGVDAVLMTELTRKNRRATRSADRIGTKYVGQERALAGESINAGIVDDRIQHPAIHTPSL